MIIVAALPCVIWLVYGRTAMIRAYLLLSPPFWMQKWMRWRKGCVRRTGMEMINRVNEKCSKCGAYVRLALPLVCAPFLGTGHQQGVTVFFPLSAQQECNQRTGW